MRERGSPAKTGASPHPDEPPVAPDEAEIETLVQRHTRFGWRALFVFLSLGLVLEGLHGFKIGWYLDVSNATRRHMWTLAHAHGTLLAMLNLIFAGTIRHESTRFVRGLRLGSACLLSGAILLPLGFFLGGWFIHEGDPGVGIVIVPVGAVLALITVFLAARAR